MSKHPYFKNLGVIIFSITIILTLSHCHRPLSFDELIDTPQAPETNDPTITSINLVNETTTPPATNYVTLEGKNTLIFDTCKNIIQKVLIAPANINWTYQLNEDGKKYFKIEHKKDTLIITTLHTTPNDIVSTLTLRNVTEPKNPIFTINLRQKSIPVIDAKVDSALCVSSTSPSTLTELTSTTTTGVGKYTKQASSVIKTPPEDTLQLTSNTNTVYLKIKVSTKPATAPSGSSACTNTDGAYTNYEQSAPLWVAALWRTADWISITNITTSPPASASTATESNNVVGTNKTLYVGINVKENTEDTYRNAYIELRINDKTGSSISHIVNIYQEKKATAAATP